MAFFRVKIRETRETNVTVAAPDQVTAEADALLFKTATPTTIVKLNETQALTFSVTGVTNIVTDTDNSLSKKYATQIVGATATILNDFADIKNMTIDATELVNLQTEIATLTALLDSIKT